MMERCRIACRLTRWRFNQQHASSICLQRHIWSTEQLMRQNWRKIEPRSLINSQTFGERPVIFEDDGADLLDEDEPIIKPSETLIKQRSSLDNTSFAAKLLADVDQDEISLFAEKENLDSFDLTLEELEQKIKSIKSELKQLRSQPGYMDPDYRLKQMLLGKSDPSEKPSLVPCGGCGANLHCTSPLLPGFVEAEDFKGASKRDLATMKCVRCTLMYENEFLKLDIDESAYENVMNRIKDDKQALVIMVVDVTDIANTLIEGYINDMVKSHPVVIVGNKIDLIPPDSGGHKHLYRIHDRILDACYRAKLDPAAGDIKDLFLISAKTGFGVEPMISSLLKKWRTNGNVYLVGTTNCGKSSLFNRFLKSDYCKSTCRDVVQRATISRWPGTTFDLLKFPLARLSFSKIFLRNERIKEDRLIDQEMVEKRKQLLYKEGQSRNVVLYGHVGKTDFRSEKEKEEDDMKFTLTGQKFCEYSVKESDSDAGKQEIEHKTNVNVSMFVPTKRIINTDEYPDSQWVFDTPGLINSQQILNDMTPDELQVLMNMPMIRPRVYIIHPGDTMFVTGMGRIDYLKGEVRTLATVHLQHRLPVRVVKTKNADQFYEDYLNSKTWDFMLKMPMLTPGRLEKLAPLEGEYFTFSLDDPTFASVDVQLSSLGWVSFAGETSEAEIKVYTPGRKGIHLRKPALLPNILTFKGTRIKDTQAYALRKLIPYNFPRNRDKGNKRFNDHQNDIDNEFDKSFPINKNKFAA